MSEEDQEKMRPFKYVAFWENWAKVAKSRSDEEKLKMFNTFIEMFFDINYAPAPDSDRYIYYMMMKPGFDKSYKSMNGGVASGQARKIQKALANKRSKEAMDKAIVDAQEQRKIPSSFVMHFKEEMGLREWKAGSQCDIPVTARNVSVILGQWWIAERNKEGYVRQG